MGDGGKKKKKKEEERKKERKGIRFGVYNTKTYDQYKLILHKPCFHNYIQNWFVVISEIKNLWINF